MSKAKKWKGVDYEAMAEAVLCYVDDDRCAYFTTAPLDQQWGDDWNDAPYEHNAGRPYQHDAVEIYRVYWDSDHETPSDVANGNSYYSVEAINKRCVPWLAPSRWGGKDLEPIWAGTTLREFVAVVLINGGGIWLPVHKPNEVNDAE